jgi:polyvinyl alcohol dehydrogenase (cytochrome)
LRGLIVRSMPAVVALFVIGSMANPAGARPQDAGDWPAYLLTVGHSSFNQAATAITPANAAGLQPAWTWVPDPPTQEGQPPGYLYASPTVSNGTIYIGSATGDFYAIEEDTGQVEWKVFVAFVPAQTCAGEGFTSTATVAPDPVTRQPTIYVGAADGYLYALDAADGSVDWRTQILDPGTSQGENAGYLWASPTVVAKHIYIGMSSQCDHPLIRGGLTSVDQATGAVLATYYTVAPTSDGGSIWSTAAASTNGSKVWVTTGNADLDGHQPGDSFSIVRLDGNSLAKTDKWTVPGLNKSDRDFGASPTLFTATLDGTPTQMIGACNKNGNFYALRATNLRAGPVWTDHVGKAPIGECLAAAIWDGTRLFVPSNTTTIGTNHYQGAVRQVDPATGAYLWETGLPGQVVGSPTLDGSGVIAAGTFYARTNAVYLLDADNGSILATVDTGGAPVFAQPVFAGPYLLVASVTNGLAAYAVPGS